MINLIFRYDKYPLLCVAALALLLFDNTNMLAQKLGDREHIISQTNVEKLNQIADDFLLLQSQFTDDSPRVRMLENGQEEFFSHYDKHGTAIYFSLENESAAISSNVDDIRIGGNTGLDLDGSDIEIGLWDGGSPRATHRELVGKINLVEPTDPHGHATHVAGILVATGLDSKAGGMAPGASIASYTSSEWNAEVALWAAQGGMISNHSYIVANPMEDYEKFGIYNVHAQNWDILSYNAPYLIMCTGASNNGNNGFNPDNSRYDLLASNKLGKNAIVVGSCFDVLDYTGPESVEQAVFTSWGPTDDWRIKPDITAVGVGSYSTREANDFNYTTGNGSSFAVAVVSGGLGLLQQHYHNINGVYMKATTAKALILSTADEAGTEEGPDFSNGWGLFNAEKAAELISNDGNSALLSELTLEQGETYTYTFEVDGTQSLSVAISWNDPAAEPLLDPRHNDSTLMLINDLDLRVTSNTDELFPWKMEPNATYDNYTDPAVRGDNYRDNIEIISEEFVEAGTYTLTVTHKGELLDGTQDYSLLINGILQNTTATSNQSAEFGEPTLYPNPVNKLLNVDIGPAYPGDVFISLYDISGRKHYVTKTNRKSAPKIDVSNLPKGTYLIEITDKNSKIGSVQKVVVH